MKLTFKKLDEVPDVPLKVWSADSSSEPIKHFVIQFYDNHDGSYFTCTCKGFQHNSKCWHIDKAKENA